MDARMLQEFFKYVFPFLVMGWVVWRMMRRTEGRPLKPSRLWIRPAILALFLLMAFLRPPAINLLSISVFAAALALGVGFGYLTARHQHLHLDKATGTIRSKPSRVGIALFVMLFAGRYAFRMAVEGGDAPDRLTAHSGQFLMWTDAGLIFILALVLAQAWEIWRRAKPLLDGHVAEKAGLPDI